MKIFILEDPIFFVISKNVRIAYRKTNMGVLHMISDVLLAMVSQKLLFGSLD